MDAADTHVVSVENRIHNNFGVAPLPPLLFGPAPLLQIPSLPGIVSTTIPDGPNKIFIGNLPYDVDEGQLKELLQSFGPLSGFNVVRDSATGMSKVSVFCSPLGLRRSMGGAFSSFRFIFFVCVNVSMWISRDGVAIPGVWVLPVRGRRKDGCGMWPAEWYHVGRQRDSSAEVTAKGDGPERRESSLFSGGYMSLTVFPLPTD